METLQVDKNRYKAKGCPRQASLKEEVQTHCLPRPQFHKVLDDLVVTIECWYRWRDRKASFFFRDSNIPAWYTEKHERHDPCTADTRSKQCMKDTVGKQTTPWSKSRWRYVFVDVKKYDAKDVAYSVRASQNNKEIDGLLCCSTEITCGLEKIRDEPS